MLEYHVWFNLKPGAAEGNAMASEPDVLTTRET